MTRPVAEQQVHIELLALLHLVNDVASRVVHGLIIQFHGVKGPQLGQSIAPFFDFDAVQQFTTFDPSAPGHDGEFGFFLTVKFNGPDVDVRPGFHIGLQIELERIVGSRSAKNLGFHYGVRIAAVILIGFKTQGKILKPQF